MHSQLLPRIGILMNFIGSIGDVLFDEARTTRFDLGGLGQERCSITVDELKSQIGFLHRQYLQFF